MEQPLPKLGPSSKPRQDAGEHGQAQARAADDETADSGQLKEAGYAGGYDAVRRYAQRWRQEHAAESAGGICAANLRARRGLPVRLEPRDRHPGWRDDGGEGRADAALPQPHAVHPGAYPREAQEMLFDAHDKAFAFYEGAARRGIYDNMKTAVDAIFVGKERLFNRRFQQMMSHYLVEPTPCTPGAAWEKGQVENQVKNLRKGSSCRGRATSRSRTSTPG